MTEATRPDVDAPRLTGFDALSFEEQVTRLRALAVHALGEFLLPGAELTLLSHWHNTTFRVDLEGRALYCLRLCRPGAEVGTFLESEIRWLRAIRRDTPAIVPEPVEVAGRLFVVASVAGVPEPRACVLFRWLEGEKIAASQVSMGLLEQVGRCMATLHRHAETWRPPPHFERRRWDLDGLLRANLGVDAAVARSRLEAWEIAVIDRAAASVRAAMDYLGQSADAFNLVHADLVPSNYLVHHGEVRVIDFDDSGFGNFVYDAAVTLSALRARPDLLGLQEAFLAGYRSIRPLRNDHVALLDHFTAARLITRLLWLAGHSAEPQFGPRALERARRDVLELEAILSHLEGDARGR